MRIYDHNWIFDIDYAATANYSEMELQGNCQCDDCQSFYRAVDIKYPSLRGFLLRFGIQIFAPDSLTAYRYEHDMECSLLYKVFGSISQIGNEVMFADGVSVTAELIDDFSFYLSLSLVIPYSVHPEI